MLGFSIGFNTVKGSGEAPTPSAPVNTTAPVLSGSQLEGGTLTTNNGTWTGFPAITFTYQWQRNGSNISGETSNSYTVLNGDIGDTLRCVVTATNSEGSDSANSNGLVAEAAPPVNTVAPVVSGDSEAGSQLTTTNGTWTGTATITFAYQWQRDGVDISGATSSTYTTVSADYDTDIRCVVTGTNSADSVEANSNTITITALAPSNTVAPVVSGNTGIGDTLTTTNGTWNGIPTPTFTYQWQRNSVDISGATSSTYVLVADDDGTDVRCVVTASNVGGTVSANSNAVSIVDFAPTDITGLGLWLDAADVSTITESSGAVSQWDDKSGNNNHATQSTGSSQPTTGSVTIGGVNAIDFNGDFFDIPAITGRTFFFVTDNLLGSTQAPIVSSMIGTEGLVGTNQQYIFINTVNLDYTISVDGLGVSLNDSATAYLDNGDSGSGGNIDMGTSIADKKDERIWAVVGEQDYINLTTVARLGTGPGGILHPLVGVIGEMIIYDTVLTTSEINQVGNYLADKWGITWTDISIPIDIPNLYLWVDASDTSTITETGGDVTDLDDKSGNGRHLAQTNPTHRPITGVTTINGLNVIDFDGDNVLEYFHTTSYNITEQTTFVVFKESDDDLNCRVISQSQNGNQDFTGPSAYVPVLRDGTATHSFGSFDGTSNTSILTNSADNTEVIFVSNHSSSQIANYMNGGAGTTSNDSLNLDIKGFGVGGRVTTDNATTGVVGSIAEVIVYDRSLSNTEVNEVGNYLADKWGITWTDLS